LFLCSCSLIQAAPDAELSREYIRLGGRVIAIENVGRPAPVLSLDNLGPAGPSDTVVLNVQPQVPGLSWQVQDGAGSVTMLSDGGLRLYGASSDLI
jgi:hypothetical protein